MFPKFPDLVIMVQVCVWTSLFQNKKDEVSLLPTAAKLMLATFMLK